MDHIDISTRQVRTFGLMLIFFAAFLGGLAWVRGEALVMAGTVLAVAWIAAILFSDVDRRSKKLGILLPVLCLGIGVPIYFGASERWVATVVWIGGSAVALASLAAPRVGRIVHAGWSDAAIPIGWSISRAILGVTYYLVLTPIGVLMRLFGHDPMRRKSEPEASSDWIDHEQVTDPRRYFKQF